MSKKVFDSLLNVMKTLIRLNIKKNIFAKYLWHENKFFFAQQSAFNSHFDLLIVRQQTWCVSVNGNI